MVLKARLISHTDVHGGAARATYRIHQSLRQHGVDSLMEVSVAGVGDWTVQTPFGKWRRALNRLRAPCGALFNKVLRTENRILHSTGILPSSWPEHLNGSDADIIHLNWVGAEMMSISDIGALEKPLVWTLHDMWAFCGAEHVTLDERWREGYRADNRPRHERGFDLNRWTWARKIRAWKRPIHIVTPSYWMAQCVRRSALMGEWPVSVIPNTVDTDVWLPVDKAMARKLLQLPADVPILLFGAIGGTQEYHKGFDLLKVSLDHLRGHLPELQVVIFGEVTPREPVDLGFSVHYIGILRDDVSLRLLYSAGDVMAIPSRVDNFPNTGVEAHACGTPVVAFDVCGLPDIVVHKVTGYLAHPFDPIDFASGLLWVLRDRGRQDVLGREARKRAINLWSYQTIASKYFNIYQHVLLNPGSGC